MTGVSFKLLSLAVVRRIRNYVRWMRLERVSQAWQANGREGGKVDQRSTGWANTYELMMMGRRVRVWRRGRRGIELWGKLAPLAGRFHGLDTQPW